MSSSNLHPYWQQTATPDNIKRWLNGRLGRLKLHLLDVHDMKELLNLKSLRFAERLFGLIDIRCTGFISVDELSDFVYSFENHHLQFQLYIIFHCYDQSSRGHLTSPEIKSMFMENFIEGGCKADHRMIGCMTEAIVSQLNPESSLVSYQQLTEMAKYYPNFLCHLLRSKIPPGLHSASREAQWHRLVDVSIDYSGRLFSLSVFFLILISAVLIGMLRYVDDELTEILGWSHVIGRSTSDLFKILITFYAATLCNATPFIYRKAPSLLHVRFQDIQVFQDLILGIMLMVLTVHSICQCLNMWRLTEKEIDASPSSSFFSDRNQPSFQSLLRSNVFITGLLLYISFAITVITQMTKKCSWSLSPHRLNRIRELLYEDDRIKVAILSVFVVLIASHSATDFMSNCIKLPCLVWLWLGFPVLAVVLDRVIFKILDPVSSVGVVDYQIMPTRGTLLTLSKPMDCRLGALSFVCLSFPKTPMHAPKAFPVLSHPSEDSLSLLIRAKDTWSISLLHYFHRLESKRLTEGEGIRDVDVTVDTVEAGQSSPARARIQHPDRLTRLNTRVVYLTRTQRMAGVVGDDPQALAAERRALEMPEPRVPRRMTGNFNVILEITPASLSTGDSVHREEPRSSDRQAADEAMPSPPVAPSPLPEPPTSVMQIGTDVVLRGPYKLNNTFSEGQLLKMLSYPVLFLSGYNFSSIPLVPLCGYLRMRRPMSHRERSQSLALGKIFLSWQVECFEDLVWLLELLEPLHDLRSMISFEARVHTRQCLNAFSPSALFYKCMAQIVKQPSLLNLPMDSRASLSFGMRDWEYQMEALRNEIGNERVGVMVDGPHSDQRQIRNWIRLNAADQFEVLSLGTVAI